MVLRSCSTRFLVRFPPQVENVREVLQLSAEQKGALVPVGELTVLLSKLSTGGAQQEELATLTNGNAANGTSEFTESRRQSFSETGDSFDTFKRVFFFC